MKRDEKMNYYTIKSIPQTRFAHAISRPTYRNIIPPRNNTMEITYISKGSLHHFNKNGDYIVQEGDFFFNPYVTQNYVESEDYHEHHTVCFTLDFDITDEYVPGALTIPTHIVSPRNRCKNLMDEIIRNHTIYANSELKCAGLFLQLLYELSENVSADSNNFSNHLYVKKIKNYIYDHIHEPIKQSEIATYLGITPEYLCSVFKKCEGTTVMSYINHIKLEGIRSIMEKEHIPLNQATELYGFSDPNYVSRLYKKYFHLNITDIVKKE